MIVELSHPEDKWMAYQVKKATFLCLLYSAGRELREILQSVNRVSVDEVHLWALTRTAAVIGGDNRPHKSI